MGHSPSNLADRLVQHIRPYGRCVVAFSGGVDSALVAKAAHLALGNQAWAVTAVSPSLASGELESARAVARQIGIRHELIHTEEFANPAYVRNEHDRCYHCKSELYARLEQIQARYPGIILVNGANADDAGDYRPGLRAAAEHQVRSPLAECGLDKAAVRDVAQHWGVSVWDKPAMPCLSSRVAYGEAVTPDRLRKIDQAEAFLRGLGMREVRVRYHRGDLARIEIPLTELSKLIADPVRDEVANRMREFGFRFVTLDIEGFRSGSLNSLVPLDILQQ